jgi:hypothetical protein
MQRAGGYRSPSQRLQQPLRHSYLIKLRHALDDALQHGQEEPMPS